MELTQEMFGKMASVLAKDGFTGVLESLVDAHLCAELHEGALKTLADFEAKKGCKLDPHQREQFIVAFVFEQTKKGILNAIADDDDDDDECNCCGRCESASDEAAEETARDALAKLLAGLSK